MTNQSPAWDRPTRFLHLGLALTVTVQLMVSLFMVAPGSRHPSTLVTHGGFIVHEWVGLAALLIVLLHWTWSVLGSGTAGIGHLFPLDRDGRRLMVTELRGLLAGRISRGGPRGGVAGLAHGLGLLAVTAVAATGGLLFVLFPPHGSTAAVTRVIREMHELLSELVWAYWFGHIGMAVLHEIRGEGVLQRMFRLR